MPQTPLPSLTFSGVLSAGLPTIGRIVYNGYEFPSAQRHRLRCTPLFSDSGMSHKCNVWTLSVAFFLTYDDEDGLATRLQDFSGAGNAGLRDKLTAPGRQLIIEDCGYGDINISPNTDGTRDVLWGPKIVDFQINRIGNQAAEVIWTCQFAIADCLNVTDGTAISKLEQNLLAAEANVEFVIDDDGLTSRVISGYIEVPQMRSDTNRPVRDVEAIFSTIVWETPVGFRRSPSDRRVSANRARIDYRIVDTEMPGDDAPPDGTTQAEVTMSLENRQPSNFHLWQWTIEGRIKSRRGFDRSHPYNAAFQILAGYVSRMRAHVLSVGQSLIPEFVRLRRMLHGREINFQFSFQVAMPIEQIITASGMFEPVPGADWNTWKASLQQIWQPRGFAQLRVEPLQEAIVNICEGGAPSVLSTDNRPSSSPSPVPIFDCQGITQQNSWIDYDNRLYGQCYSPGTEHAGSEEQTLDINDSTQADFQGAGATLLGKFDNAQTVDYQFHGPPLMRVLMVGRAKRVQFKPTVPAISTIDGQPVVEIDRRVENRKAGAYAGCTVWATEWRILYQVIQNPAAEVAADADFPNPFTGGP